jgi:hypothetical protein
MEVFINAYSEVVSMRVAFDLKDILKKNIPV